MGETCKQRGLTRQWQKTMAKVATVIWPLAILLRFWVGTSAKMRIDSILQAHFWGIWPSSPYRLLLGKGQRLFLTVLRETWLGSSDSNLLTNRKYIHDSSRIFHLDLDNFALERWKRAMDVTEPKTTTQTFRTIIEIPEFANANLIQTASQYAIIVRRSCCFKAIKGRFKVEACSQAHLWIWLPWISPNMLSTSVFYCFNRIGTRNGTPNPPNRQHDFRGQFCRHFGNKHPLCSRFVHAIQLVLP